MSPEPAAGLVRGPPTSTLRQAILPTYARADVTIVRGEGCRVWDDAGRSYLDFGAGIAVVSLGHCEPRVTAAAHAQLDALWHASNLYWTEPMLRLAGMLVERAGGGQAFFCNSGAEANEAALKYARKATGRAGIVALEGGFHGRTLGALSATGQPAKRQGFGPLVPGRHLRSAQRRRGAGAGGDAWRGCRAPAARAGAGRGGVLPLEPEFARAAAEIAREVGALLCIDEVQTGVGRTGTFFGYEQLGLEPDLVTLAKGLGNGLPIGALLVAARAAGGLQPGDHGSTFGGNPVAAAAACAVVEAVDEALLANVRERGHELHLGLARMAGVVEVRGRGLLLGVRLDRAAAPVVDACREQGVLLLSAGEDVLRLAPPLVVGADEVQEALNAVYGALATT